MKFMHLSDLHLGKSLGDFDLIDDQKYILDRLIEICREKKVDAVLIAGDVYDKSIPSEAATGLLDRFLKELVENGIAVYLISGNHDSDDRLNFGSSLFMSSQVYINSVFSGTMAKNIMEDEYGTLNVYSLPFVKASQVRHYYPDQEIKNYEDAVRTVIEQAGINEKERNLMIAHQFVAGNSDPEMSGSEGLGTQTVGLVEKIGWNVFDGFDYAALGHIHAPQKIGRNEVRYAGSPLKYSLSEVNSRKSVPIIDMKEKGNVQIELVPLIPLRDIRHITGTLRELLDPKNVKSPEDFIYATLTDEDEEPNLKGIFSQTYPNTVKIDYDNSRTRECGQVDLDRIEKTKSFPELIRDFYEQMYGCEISEEEMKIMESAAREAGVLHEAD
ncbi:MAG: exonuclease SbcCD subunit D [Erysipelotrichaceae bacterium]|nr:exonuclease SbcCD subunit D [Erysipelotrichaceae bacterium]